MYQVMEPRNTKRRTSRVGEPCWHPRKGQYFRPGRSNDSQIFVLENFGRIGEIFQIMACDDGIVSIIGTKGVLRPDGFVVGESLIGKGEGSRIFFNTLKEIGIVNDQNIDTIRDRILEEGTWEEYGIGISKKPSCRLIWRKGE